MLDRISPGIALQPSSYADIIRRLRELDSFRDDEDAAAALAATLALFGAVLIAEERAALADALPSDLARELHQAPAWAFPRSQKSASRSIALKHEAAMNQAIAHAPAVCRALGEILTPHARARLAHAVPRLAGQLEPPRYVARSSSARVAHEQLNAPPKCGLQQEREARSLTNARPGWRRLLSST